jgi:hypothetical protein
MVTKCNASSVRVVDRFGKVGWVASDFLDIVDNSVGEVFVEVGALGYWIAWMCAKRSDYAWGLGGGYKCSVFC